MVQRVAVAARKGGRWATRAVAGEAAAVGSVPMAAAAALAAAAAAAAAAATEAAARPVCPRVASVAASVGVEAEEVAELAAARRD